MDIHAERFQVLALAWRLHRHRPEEVVPPFVIAENPMVMALPTLSLVFRDIR
jgi:hypothetical protein